MCLTDQNCLIDNASIVVQASGQAEVKGHLSHTKKH